MSVLKDLKKILVEHLPKQELDFVSNILYGSVIDSDKVLETSSSGLVAKSYSLVQNGCQGQRSRSRSLKLGLCQMLLHSPTTDPISVQKTANMQQGLDFLQVAAKSQVKIFCFQELWTMPMGFCTGQKLPWVEFAEDALEGQTTKTLQPLAKLYDMVIISPILEVDSNGEYWNSAVVIDATGEVLGVYRKTHIPIAGNESIYFRHSNRPIPVFQTKFGKVGVAICYDRHFAQCWYALRLAGAEVVFNPCASVASFSEHLWRLEGRAAAVANGFFVASINRVGTETFVVPGNGTVRNEKRREFYGSTYVASPAGSCTPGLSTEQSELLIVEVDLLDQASYQTGHRFFGERLAVLEEIGKQFEAKS